MNFNEFGYLKVAACAPEVVIGDPLANAERVVTELKRLSRAHVALALFPELSLTGYTCEDLFFSQALHTDCEAAIERIVAATTSITAVIGVPWQTRDGRLLNCALVASNGRVCGVVPKLTQPNYGEFYEMRWFTSGADVSEAVNHPILGDFWVDHRQLFEIASPTGSAAERCCFAIEICEDLWTPEPPGARHALAGAELILNPSASNELIGKADYRRDLVRMTSAQRLCGYLYASSGPTESSKDVVFGGHLLAAENGQLVAEGERFDLHGQHIVTEFDAERLRHERMQNISFASAERPQGYRTVACGAKLKALKTLTRTYPRHPFVPDDGAEFDARAREIMSIQATGLARRMRSANIEHLVLGLSGGLDSTQAFLVTLDALQQLGLDRSHLHAFTLPGPGTSSLTKGSAHQMCAATGVPLEEISIDSAVKGHLKDLGHPASARDVVFENAQARERTQILFNQANRLSALVVGTGDLSELALGWCTFNADHMANYNVNAGVPKTMMSYLVRWYAEHRADEELGQVLLRVLDTPISPELLPPSKGQISQSTETIIGPYELHDFFLYHFMRNGFGPEKIFGLAATAFANDYSPQQIKDVLHTFFRRFYTQQFKRTTLPPGPKVGSVSLSPRGDWRMPDEASVGRILARIKAIRTTQGSKRSTKAKTTRRKRS